MRKNNKRKYALYGFVFFLVLAIKSVVYSDIPVEILKEKYANEFSKFVEIDGMQVHYRVEGKGIPIVLIHGTGASLHTWDDWTLKLKENYQVIRMDLPAFGLTGPNKSGDYSIKQYTQFLEEFVVKMKLDSMFLAGNSLGGNIAWNYASKNPEKVQKLILVDASGLPTNKPQPWIFKMAKTPVLSKLFLYITPRNIIEDNLKQVYEDDTKISDALITRFHDMALREGNRKAFVDRAKIDFKISEASKEEQLQNIQTPTLLIWGAKDTWIPLDNGKRMDALLPNSKLVVLQNSGHVPMEENPKESFKVLNDFLHQKNN
ncbi:alpha/beta hydrolase [Polaribacter sp.]|nr:alpha/beta hydrolase [Polaribacter sp.]MDB0026236.1 alpha/beta hydrolase [Polaribacter sp.]MDB0040214.1 alpha/beta hydrolase [Polaribacter sp.]MDB4167375.1 alpha/beta hydrolase [Polaribacter sp.]MDB4201483.1 alpha/beta hydrolase [Polaribacter sp.]